VSGGWLDGGLLYAVNHIIEPSRNIKVIGWLNEDLNRPVGEMPFAGAMSLSRHLSVEMVSGVPYLAVAPDVDVVFTLRSMARHLHFDSLPFTNTLQSVIPDSGMQIITTYVLIFCVYF
jgi:hypothetical protein